MARLKRIAAHRTGRSRNVPVRIIWHDTPSAELQQRGLAVAEQRGAWRLERMIPDGSVWAPGAPGPVLAEAPSLAELQPLPAASLMPVAAFEGRVTSLDLARDGEAVSLRLLDGVLRGVTAERRTTRIRVTGDEAPALAVALDLAEDLDATVADAALASEAIAAARAEQPAPRRLGAPSLPAELTVGEAFAYLAGHLTDVMLHWGRLIDAGEAALEPVHQMRVAMRRLRSAVSQFRPAVQRDLLDEASAGLRALAAVLGPARDWDVFCSQTGVAVDATFGPDPRLGKLLAAAERRRAEHYRSLRQFIAGTEYRKLMIRLAALAVPLPADAPIGPEQRAALDQPLAEFATHVLDKRLRRLLQAGEDINALPAPALHEVRLLGKRLRYNAEFFTPVWPRNGTKRFLRRLAALQEALGVLNDGAVAAELMRELGGAGADRAFAVGVVLGFVAGRRAGSGGEIAHAWDKLQGAGPFWR